MSVVDNQLTRMGYVLRLSGWMGRLGNHLIQLSCAINVAQKSKSLLLVPPHGILKKAKYDFRVKGEDNCNEEISGPFFLQTDCYQFPIRYDQERRQIFLEYIRQQMTYRSLKGRLRDRVFPEPDTRLDDDTLVINMRSGTDIFRSSPPPQSDYMQPPLSFYKYIIEKYDYRTCLIVSEPERANPVIAALLSWGQNRDIRIKTHRSVQNDVATVLNARHLIAAHSTFTWCLALMSHNIRVYHQPHTCRIRGTMDFDVHTYEFSNYIKPGEWTASNAQLDLMVNHPVSDVRMQEPPQKGERVLSACW
jgi:hypothetical protein